MKILSLTRDYPSDLSLASRHDIVYACLNGSPDREVANSFLQLPTGSFDIRVLLDQLPPNWRPDVVQITSSIGVCTPLPSIPTALEQLHCPTVMKLTDSHHRHRPIQSLIEYAQLVKCNYHWTTYDRHHLHFFNAAGLPNCFWMPGSISIKPYQVSITEIKNDDVLFCGQNSATGHPRRAKLLTLIQNSGVKLTVTRKSYEESLQAYAGAKIVFNCSLNGDLNRRVFEVLMAGGFLLTDRLPAESGLLELFQEGVHLECYNSETELLEKMQHYLAYPEQARVIAQEGQRKFMAEYHPHRLEDQFFQFVVKGQALPDIFLAKDDDRVHQVSEAFCPSHALMQRIRIYELLHELHRINDRLNLIYFFGTNQDLIKDLRDLTRLDLTHIEITEHLQSIADQQFQIVMLDCPTTQVHLQSLLDMIEPYLMHQGLLLILGEAASQVYSVSRAQAWASVHLTESGEGACAIYQKVKSRDERAKAGLNLPIVASLSFSRRLVLNIKTNVKKLLLR